MLNDYMAVTELATEHAHAWQYVCMSAAVTAWSARLLAGRGTSKGLNGLSGTIIRYSSGTVM